MKLAALAALFILAGPANAADEYLCNLWAKEVVRVNLLCPTDPDYITADEELIGMMLDRAYHRCLSYETDTPRIPDCPARDASAFIAFMARNVIGRQQALADIGTVPATDAPSSRTQGLSCEDGPCLKPGSEEWRDYCRANWRTYRSSDDTVVRSSSGGRRVLCPA